MPNDDKIFAKGESLWVQFVSLVVVYGLSSPCLVNTAKLKVCAEPAISDAFAKMLGGTAIPLMDCVSFKPFTSRRQCMVKIGFAALGQKLYKCILK